MNQAEMIAIWDEHIGYEFSTRDVSSTIATMVEDAYVNHVPVMTGGYGHAALRRFYKEDFISLMPADTSIKLISRTLGQDQLVDEMIFSFTHTEEMPWMLPGVPPTHRHVDIPLGRCCRLSRRQAGARAHLLGPGVRAQTNRPAHGSHRFRYLEPRPHRSSSIQPCLDVSMRFDCEFYSHFVYWSSHAIHRESRVKLSADTRDLSRRIIKRQEPCGQTAASRTPSRRLPVRSNPFALSRAASRSRASSSSIMPPARRFPR